MKLIRADYIIVIAFALMLSNHAITNYMITKHTEYLQTEETVKAYIKLAERNPLIPVALLMSKARLMYSLFLLPSITFGIYYFLRKKYYENQAILETSAVIIGMSALINFFNDASILLGFFAR